MKILRNERGIALVTSLMLSFLALVIILALLYIVSQGTKLSASSKRYKSALEASYGGAEVFTKDIIPLLMKGTTDGTSLSSVLAGNAPVFGNTTCLNGVNGAGGKLNSIPSKWGAYCTGNMKSVAPNVSPDTTFTLRGQPGQPDFKVYAKIVDTQPGNSDVSGTESLDSGAGVAYGAAGVSPKHMPATYRIEVRGERATNPLEKANLSVLYAY